jgi:hypothetical protein
MFGTMPCIIFTLMEPPDTGVIEGLGTILMFLLDLAIHTAGSLILAGMVTWCGNRIKKTRGLGAFPLSLAGAWLLGIIIVLAMDIGRQTETKFIYELFVAVWGFITITGAMGGYALWRILDARKRRGKLESQR